MLICTIVGHQGFHSIRGKLGAGVPALKNLPPTCGILGAGDPINNWGSRSAGLQALRKQQKRKPERPYANLRRHPISLILVRSDKAGPPSKLWNPQTCSPSWGKCFMSALNPASSPPDCADVAPEGILCSRNCRNCCL